MRESNRLPLGGYTGELPKEPEGKSDQSHLAEDAVHRNTTWIRATPSFTQRRSKSGRKRGDAALPQGPAWLCRQRWWWGRGGVGGVEGARGGGQQEGDAQPVGAALFSPSQPAKPAAEIKGKASKLDFYLKSHLL